jgi:hypothetical protein
MSGTVSQEDIAQPASWPSEEHTWLDKGKGKERQGHAENQDSRTSSKSPDAFSSSYPPINDDVEESRRVEEASLVNQDSRLLSK